MNLNIILLMLTSIVALFTSVVVFPTDRDIDYLRLLDGDFASAQTAYNEHLSRGDWSEQTVIPLIKAYQQGGKLREAIALTEQLNDREPNRLELLSLLNELYQRANMYGNYVETLAQIVALNPQPTLLRQLANEYAYSGQVEKQISVIAQLIETDAASAEDRVSLARLYASQGQTFSQQGDLLNPEDAKQASLSLHSRKVLISYLLDQNKSIQVTQIIEHWFTDKQTTLAASINLGYWLINNGHANLIQPSLQNKMPQVAQSQDTLARLFFDIDIASGNHESALVRLHQWQLNNELPDALYPLYFKLATANDNKNHPEILSHILTLVTENTAFEKHYIAALQHNKKKSKLAAYLLAKTQHKQLSITQESFLINELIATKKYRTVLPYLQQKALEETEQWLYTYVRIADKVNKKNNALNHIWANYQNSNITPHQQRQIAYLLLESGQKKRAEFIFTALAKHASFDSRDVQQLFFLWGPRPNPQIINWIAEKTTRAHGEQQILWLKKLIQLGATFQVFHILKSANQLDFAAPQRLWVDAVTRAKNIDPESTHIQFAIDTFTDLTALHNLANFTVHHNKFALAETIWQKILTLHPEAPEALRQIGLLEYRRSAWQNTVTYLQKYLDSDQQQQPAHSVEVNYFLADAWRLMQQESNSFKHYRIALQLIENLPNIPLRIQSLKPVILTRLGQPTISLAVFDELFNKGANSKDFVSNYASVLLEHGHYDKVKYVLQYQK